MCLMPLFAQCLVCLMSVLTLMSGVSDANIYPGVWCVLMPLFTLVCLIPVFALVCGVFDNSICFGVFDASIHPGVWCV